MVLFVVLEHGENESWERLSSKKSFLKNTLRTGTTSVSGGVATSQQLP